MIHPQITSLACNGALSAAEFRTTPPTTTPYFFGNLCRRLVLPMRVATWSLTSLQQRVVKSDGRLIKHLRYYWRLLAESHTGAALFAGMLRKISALPSPAG